MVWSITGAYEPSLMALATSASISELKALTIYEG